MELELIRVLLWVIGGLLGVLVVIIGWVGVRIHSRLDEIAGALRSIENDLRADITDHAERLVALEATCRSNHRGR